MTTSSSVIRQPRPSSLADVLDLILDKGLVIDAYVRVSLVGIELLTIDARIVIASVDTYLRFAEATNRLDLRNSDDSQGLPQLVSSMTQGGASSKTRGALSGVKDEVSSWFGGDGDEDQDQDQQRERERQPARASRGREGRSSGGSERRARSDDDSRRTRSSRRDTDDSGDGDSSAQADEES